MTTSIWFIQNFWLKLSTYCSKKYWCLTKNPRLFLMRTIARFESVRNWISYFHRGIDKSFDIYGENPSIFGDINVNSVVLSLKNDSCYLGINLPQDILQELLNFAMTMTCYGNRDPTLAFYYSQRVQVEMLSGKQFHIASYLDNIKMSLALKKLESDSGLLAIAAKFLGADPVHIGSDLLWSFPTLATPLQRLEAAQVFHYDLDDYRFIKFFFYLTDVDLSSGPHVCIRGSHKNKKFSHQLLGVRCASKEDKEIVDYYGAENVLTICGRAGFGFVEDASCFHKATPPRDKDRLLLQIEYAINDYGDLRSF